jgi:monofunctional biosynthetic peptidoglycan transglycosylase
MKREHRGGPGRWLLTAALLAVAAVVAMVAWAALRAAAVDVAALERTVPRRTAMMLRREAADRDAGRAPRTVQRWVPYERISPLLRRAVLVAEDDAFFQHGGLDWNEIRASARQDLERRRFTRGGSTLTQQLAKNLWLGPERTPWRKLEEVFLALRLERTLSKRRIFELYLNLIEWGDGVYGAEAAARRWFGVPASALDARQAVRLAAVIINPRRYSPVEPSRRIERRIRIIASRLRRRGALDEATWRDVVGAPPAPAPSPSPAADEPPPDALERAAPDSSSAPPPGT